ncbi:Ig domain-containing protein, partial [Planctomycetota bacterium]
LMRRALEIDEASFGPDHPNCKFWEREQLSFSLVKAPKWLKIDSETGLITGTAPANNPDRPYGASYPVSIRATATFEKRTGKDTFTDDLPPKIHAQDFELIVSN